MRRKPIDRSEVRIVGGRIITCPANAFKVEDHDYHYDRTTPSVLWEPLLRSLKRQHKRLGLPTPELPKRWRDLP